MAPPPELNTDAISEILLRLPLDDPAGLVRASAVCKPWLRTLTDPAFLRRYRAFHGTPRVLGFLHNQRTDSAHTHFVPTTAFRPHAGATADRYRVFDCRHGRVLLYDYGATEFVVWDPVTGRERRIPDVDEDTSAYTKHAVLCAAGAGCDHSTCGGGPFPVASAGTRCSNIGESCACFYSSETGAWSEQTSLCHQSYYSLDDDDQPAAFAEGALYFAGVFGEVLRYDVLGGRGLQLMELRPDCHLDRTILMTTSSGGLGSASLDDGMLSVWEMVAATWVHIKLIDLEELLPVDICTSSAWLSGFAEDANVIFLSTDDNGIFTIDLKSLLARKVSDMGSVDRVLPYVI